MHEISQRIEETGALSQVYPDCGFVFDVVALWDEIKRGGNATRLIEEWRQSAANATIAEES
jgi:hypothetical protein